MCTSMHHHTRCVPCMRDTRTTRDRDLAHVSQNNNYTLAVTDAVKFARASQQDPNARPKIIAANLENGIAPINILSTTQKNMTLSMNMFVHFSACYDSSISFG